MKTIYDPKLIEEATCATVGFFDGVHLGHRFLLEQLKKQAHGDDTGDLSLPTAAITFAQHPRQVLQSDFQPQLLTSLDERLQQLATTGVDYCYVLDFTPALAATSAKEFLQNTLSKQLKVKKLLAGYDHRFGKGRIDDFQNYVDYGTACGMTVRRGDPRGCPTANALPISSTAIRRALAEGNQQAANEMLGYTYALAGKVVTGDRLGHQIGFPTANLELLEPLKMLPKEGAYAVRTHLPDGRIHSGMAYIGHRPSLAKWDELRIEIHLFDFSGDLYGQILSVEFVDFLRPSAKFGSVAELKAQLQRDMQRAKEI
ncbi:riboflavin biosynthesis protein [Bacteroidia bacterium]|nr:riboflavin biosynthesis protein [Bacteroidia bacterium]